MLHARPVEGPYRRARVVANAVLIAILFAVPWIRIAGEPLVMLDVPARRFHVFGLVIFPQELYFLWLVLAMLAVALFFFTSLAGRLWCGWACPQTVFTDLFAGIARRIEGRRRRGERAPLARRLATHAVWLAICAIAGFHLVAYFRSPYALVSEISAGALSGASLGFLVSMTALAYLDFAIVRQTFCKYLCPYARFQGVLFDRDTLVIGYDARRGEPRGKKGSVEGDCVDCRLCVAVCPTDIDIRNGLQLECIACTQCVDACDGVMQKLGRPRGLIDYRALSSLEGSGPARILRPRVAIYAAALVAVIAVFGVLLEQRQLAGLDVMRNRSALSSPLADGRVANAYTLHIQNRARAARRFEIRVDPAADFELIAGINPVEVAAAAATEAQVFVVARAGTPRHTADRAIDIVLQPLDDAAHPVVRETRFMSLTGLPAGAAKREGDPG